MLKMCAGCHEKFLSCLCIDCSEMKICREKGQLLCQDPKGYYKKGGKCFSYQEI